MKIVAFMGQKGGTGKTTLAVHTAVAASQDGYKVVLIDTPLSQNSCRFQKFADDPQNSDTL
jgi:chromosome partitioning protein